MTLENCKLRLKVAEKKEDKVDIKFWEDRIDLRLKMLGKVPEKDNGKKPKR